MIGGHVTYGIPLEYLGKSAPSPLLRHLIDIRRCRTTTGGLRFPGLAGWRTGHARDGSPHTSAISGYGFAGEFHYDSG